MNNISFFCSNMATLVSTKRDLQEALLFSFNWKKKGVESYRLSCEVYEEQTPSQQTCGYPLQRFKKFEETELEGLFYEDSVLKPRRTCGIIRSVKTSHFRMKHNLIKKLTIRKRTKGWTGNNSIVWIGNIIFMLGLNNFQTTRAQFPTS